MKRFLKSFLSVFLIVVFVLGATTVSARRYTYITQLSATINVDNGKVTASGIFKAREGEVRLRLVLEGQLSNGDWIEVASKEVSSDSGATAVGFTASVEKGRYYRATSYGEVWIDGVCVEDDFAQTTPDN